MSTEASAAIEAGPRPTVRKLILASASAYRKALLERLGLPFESISPRVDESRREGETATALVKRLAQLKAEAIAPSFSDALVIGSDQCAVIDQTILGKPGGFDRAFKQLKSASGKSVEFHTGLCLLDPVANRIQVDDITFKVYFRNLSDAQISRYLEQERPFDCAGSFKAERLGIALFSRMQGDDPSALVGLPLIRLISMLEAVGVDVI